MADKVDLPEVSVCAHERLRREPMMRFKGRVPYSCLWCDEVFETFEATVGSGRYPKDLIDEIEVKYAALREAREVERARLRARWRNRIRRRFRLWRLR